MTKTKEKKERIGKETWEAKVNTGHVLEDTKEGTNKSPLEQMIFEGVSNALDSDATNIRLRVDGNKLTFEDNGSGMGKEEFREAFNTATRSKENDKRLGFLGQGAKIGLWYSNKAKLTTVKDNFQESAFFRFGDDNWKIIVESGLDSDFFDREEHGTQLTYYLKDEYTENLDEDRVWDILYDWFPTLFDPHFQNFFSRGTRGKGTDEKIYPHDIKFSINGKFVAPKSVIPEEYNTEKVIQQDLYYKWGKYNKLVGTCKLARVKKELPEELQGIHRSVYGAEITKSLSLGQTYPRDPEHLIGYVEFPYLAQDLLSTKEGFKTDGTAYRVWFPNAFTHKVYIPFLKDTGFQEDSHSDKALEDEWNKFSKISSLSKFDLPFGNRNNGDKSSQKKETEKGRDKKSTDQSTSVDTGKRPKVQYVDYPEKDIPAWFQRQEGRRHILIINKGYQGRKINGKSKILDLLSMTYAVLDYNKDNMNTDEMLDRFGEILSESASVR